MMNFRQAILMICIACKPPVFLTISILTVIFYLTAVVFKLLADELLSIPAIDAFQTPAFILSLIMFVCCAGWSLFFLAVAKYEINAELLVMQQEFMQSRHGFRFLPVTLIHVGTLILFEYMSYLVIDSMVPETYNFQANLASETPTSQVGRQHIVMVYNIWFCGIGYSFAYLLAEMFVNFFTGHESLMHAVHWMFIRSLAKASNKDLSDVPAGDDFNEPLERHMNRVNYAPFGRNS